MTYARSSEDIVVSISDPKADRLRDLRGRWNRSRCVNARWVPRSVYLEPGTSGFCGSVRQYIKKRLQRASSGPRSTCARRPLRTRRDGRCRLSAWTGRCTRPIRQDALTRTGPAVAVSARSHCSQPVLSLLQLWLTVPGLPASPPRLRPPFAPALHTRCLRPCPPDHPPSFSEPSATLLGQPHLSASCTSSTPAPYAPSPAPLNLASADCHDPSRSQSLLHPRPRQFPKPRSSKLPALALSRP